MGGFDPLKTAFTTSAITSPMINGSSLANLRAGPLNIFANENRGHLGLLGFLVSNQQTD